MRTSRVIRSSLQRNPANAGCIAFLTTHLANTEFAQMWALLRDPCDENVVRSGAVAAPCEKSRGRWVLAATILASSMAFIDGTVVNVALPALQTNLKATAVDVQWVIEAYALLLAALLLLGGSLGDHLGRKRIYAIGIALFALASIWCGLAPTINQLILARAAQGIG